MGAVFASAIAATQRRSPSAKLDDMTLMREYASFLCRSPGWHAVWPPVASIAEVGDYGVFHEGVFVRFGNIRDDFDIDPDPRQTESTSVSLTSASVRMIRQQAGANVNAFTAADVEARLVVELSRGNSFVLRAQRVDGTTMQSMMSVAAALKLIPAWRRSWYVVSTAYVGAPVVLLATKHSDTVVTISGKASQLLQFETQGAFDAGVSLQASHDLALELRGKRGPIAVRVFRLGLFGLVPKSVDTGPDAVADDAVELDVPADEPEDAF